MSNMAGVRFLLAVLAIALLFAVYKQGFSGALYYDDYGNLEGLSKIVDLHSAKQFVFGGFAGPLGRPIALASFALQASGWPENSASLLFVNALIHLANATLLGLLGYMCVRLSLSLPRGKAFWVAFGAALLWAGLPLLASTSLIAIQRMTGLAALFSILGLVGFTWSYRLYASSPVRGLFCQFSLLGLGTLLAMFSKESGALTPLFALAIETLVRRDVLRSPGHWVHKLRFVVLLLALAVFLIYLSPLMRDYFSVSDVRGYSAWERLQIEQVVLWDYLRALFVPMPSLFGPFHDDYPRTVDSLSSAVAAFAWLLALVLGVWLHLSGRSRWLLFAVLWFMFGHLLESTTIQLELYFEHRNYLPMYGVCLALTVAVVSVPMVYRRVAVFSFALFVLLQWAVLLSVTSMWGQPIKAANVWAAEKPASSRAVTHAVFLELSGADENVADLNYQYIRRQRYEYTLSLLDRTIEHCPGCVSVRLQAIGYACKLNRFDEAKARLRGTVSFAAGAEKPRSVVDGLFGLRELIQEGRCGDLSGNDLLALIEALSDSQLFKINHISTRIYFLAAAVAEDLGRASERDAYLLKAEASSPVALPVLQYQLKVAMATNQLEQALKAIDRRYPFVADSKGAMTKAVLDEIKAGVLEEIAQGSTGGTQERDE
ncbi:hypothetical protein [Halopseudomonas oceani]|uniref:Tetratricopeptide repeat protein n=1 Tax=Halopseudomonas oceani TaxID=1708783 RepID=A0A2P4EY98_9GAMM|nr:hypothetical protein [Halopseudomonas oceani]POB05156.1 hypothetical protein C1949_05150 [Halopseudomonas oceani]